MQRMIGAHRVGVALGMALVVGVASAWAGTANGGLGHVPKGNPLAGMTWGVYDGPIDGVWPAYAAARGRDKQLLGKIALRPRAVWAGSWER